MAAGTDDERPSDLMLKCLDSGRVDVLCSLLSQLKNKSDFHDQVDVLCCKEGTLLHRAVGLDSADFVSALLSNGANPCVQNEDGKTAYQMCKSDVVRNAFVQEALRAITLSKAIYTGCVRLTRVRLYDEEQGPVAAQSPAFTASRRPHVLFIENFVPRSPVFIGHLLEMDVCA
ncbi:hypothetical protein Y032_0018g3557 [Ancylostoma ceylanicum]|uniref:Uncharacterized protein n=1 Tax=Ancylostoma ceylanicum TaxID=53326 RepID=A0A016V2D1_9BILA|nr:hypothetical protein Y032_0018g3557 [Ancylostoma ceylanicum]